MALIASRPSMGELFGRIVPIALGAAISPVVLIVNVLLLSSQTRPVARGAAYTLGCAIIVVGFGIAGVTVIKGVSTAPRETAAYIHLAVGTISLGFAVRALIRGPKPPPKKEEVAPGDERDRAKPISEFVLAGLGAMAINMTTLTLYLSLDAEIVRSGVGPGDEAIALAVSMLIILIPCWAPLVLTIASPRIARRVFEPLNDFLTRHKWAIEIIVPGGFGVYLTILGITLLA